MIDNKNIAKTPARLIIISYAVLQLLFYVFYYTEIIHYRLITGALLISIAIILPNIKRLSGLHLSMLLPLSVVVIELVTITFFVDGNRLIYIFLIGASLVSLLYASVVGLFFMTLFTSVAVFFLLFVCDVRLLGSQMNFNYEWFNFVGMIFVYTVILMLAKYLVGVLARSRQTGLTFDKVLEESSSLIVIVNNQARVEYISKSFAKILDIEKQEYAIDLPFTDLFPYVELKCFFGELLEREGTIEATFEIIKDGKCHNFILHSIPMDTENSVMGKNKIARFFDCVEITPIIESQRAAEAATRSKSKFLATMSHEIRTPLNAIIGITQIQLYKENLPSEYEFALKKIHNSGNSLLGIINDILDVSKIETGKMELNPINYDVPNLVNDAVQMNLMQIGSKQIEFMLDVNENTPLRMHGDELRLKQILSNLLSNAVKYTEKGYVRLSVKHLIQGDDLMLIFIVEDTGQGMKPEDRDKLFSEYLRFNAAANHNVEGTGIGLSIANNLVKMMGGTIEAESEYGKGSIFTVTVKQKAVECKVIGPELSEQLRTFTFTADKQISDMHIIREPMPYGKILVVDDVDTNLFVTEGLLKPYKLNIETAISGFAVIEKIKNGNNYDVIFMDHMMPFMDGIETTQKLRTMGYDGIIVALTANALVGNDKMFKENGFDDFISKPIDIRHLNVALNQYVRDRHPEEAKKYETIATAAIPAFTVNPKVLEVFRGDAEKTIVTLRESIKSNIKLFTTATHAIKSALANIGENEKSQMAAKLENAGLNSDTDYINANTENFIKTLEELVKTIPVPEEIISKDDANILEDVAYLTEQFGIIKSACENYDNATIYQVLDRLKEKVWKKETLVTLENIRKLIYVSSDFEAVAELVG
jgi:signal transduction histidine kinase/CheY-like chemotaxis protein/HPt (histidine-containing phosphotransfer) domain-containing protein